MVPCLVTLNDLQTRRAGLLASAELLVFSFRQLLVQLRCLSLQPMHVTR